MAYVASWIAPQGCIQGGRNIEQPCRNAFNINQNFIKNETEGYYKPPFCQWPRGGSSKRETKYRIKSGEPICKAGSGEEIGDDFYYNIGKFELPKKTNIDGDEISIRTESTTLGMQTNLCTRTYGPRKKPAEFPYGANDRLKRASFKRRPLEKVYPVGQVPKTHIDVFGYIKKGELHPDYVSANNGQAIVGMPGGFVDKNENFKYNTGGSNMNGKDIKPTTPRSQRIAEGRADPKADSSEANNNNNSPSGNESDSDSPPNEEGGGASGSTSGSNSKGVGGGNKNPKSYNCGKVPTVVLHAIGMPLPQDSAVSMYKNYHDKGLSSPRSQDRPESNSGYCTYNAANVPLPLPPPKPMPPIPHSKQILIDADSRAAASSRNNDDASSSGGTVKCRLVSPRSYLQGQSKEKSKRQMMNPIQKKERARSTGVGGPGKLMKRDENVIMEDRMFEPNEQVIDFNG